MGWTVYYKGTADTAITAEEQALLDRHVATWSPKLEEGCEPYAWRLEDDGKVLTGFTKVHYSKDDQGDYVKVVRATQELETLLPRFSFLISDDYVCTEDTPPSEVEPE